jgi:hypothetical protein
LQDRLKRKNDQYRPWVTNLHHNFQAIQSITAQATFILVCVAVGESVAPVSLQIYFLLDSS